MVFCAGIVTAQNIAPFFVTGHKQIVKASEYGLVSNGEMEITLSLADTNQAKLAKFVYSVLYGRLTPKQYADKLIDSEKNKYRQELAEYANMPSRLVNWEYDERHTVSVKGSYAVLSRSISTFYGGAHPNTTVKYFIVNTKKPELLSLGGIVSRANLPKLKALAVRELKPVLASLGVTHDDNFYISELKIENYFPAAEGLVFHWNTYEVAHYAAGQIFVTVSCKEVEGLLNSKGKALAKDFK